MAKMIWAKSSWPWLATPLANSVIIVAPCAHVVHGQGQSQAYASIMQFGTLNLHATIDPSGTKGNSVMHHLCLPLVGHLVGSFRHCFDKMPCHADTSSISPGYDGAF